MVHKIHTILEKTATGMAVFLLLSLVVLSFIQVVLRNLFSMGLNLVEEFMRNGVLWIAFVGAVLTTLRGKHISIDILPRLLKSTSKKILLWILSVLASIICLVLSWLAISFIRLEIETGSTIGGVFPAWIIELIIPIGFILLALSFPLKMLEGNNKEGI